MNVAHGRKRFWSLVISGGLAGLLALVGAGFFGAGTHPVPTAHAGTHPNEGWVGDQSGSLVGRDPEGKFTQAFPLKHTDVSIQVSGPLARAQVTQEFENPYPDKIEAVYTFPLPQDAAVDSMTLTVGDRVVKGTIKKREEARAIYEAAKRRGNVAGLLDQERPNIFTQSVANILPGEKITVTISYVETLSYDDGIYSVVFPMVVGPRYIPGQPTAQVPSLGEGWAYDTDQVPDASHITPPVLKPDTRSGHDLSLSVKIDAGVSIKQVHSATHDIDLNNSKASQAEVHLKQEATIPNKDFILTYAVAGNDIHDAVLTHRIGEDGFFTLLLQPPDRVKTDEVTPKELIFVLDTSGSMSGFPIEKAKETMRLAIAGLNPRDTFNLITFAGDTHILFPEPVPATSANVRKAQAFLASRSGGGGTEMMKAIRAALEPSDSQEHVRIVCFMTDGYIGNDMAILGEVQKYPKARIFSFGIGSSVNRFLLDRMAEEGRGEVEYVGLYDDGSAAARRFHERVQHPLLTDLSVDWDGLDVSEVYPKRLPDLFSAKPLVLTGRYTTPGKGTIRLRGKVAGRSVVRNIPVDLPGFAPEHDVLTSLWARTKIVELMAKDLEGIQQGNPRKDVREAITQLGLDYRLMTQFTSFVAVEELTITEGGQPRRIEVPVELPEGVSYEGIFGSRDENAGSFGHRMMQPIAKMSRSFLGGKVARESVASSPPAIVDRVEPERNDARLGASSGKMDSTLRSLVEHVEKKSTLSQDMAQHVTDGKVLLQVWLTDTNPETLEKLKVLGFEVVAQPKTGTLVIGRLSVEKLEGFSKLPVVRYISLQRAAA
ncbi:VIT and vWA domain-containing protein [Candidatus Nitrospira neomarina]|uniref:VIT domain-containing protein n=1 Tax=Candidatus Nitrospira neomarina TaxID=3020899 RepID=A0AA96K190_9BACT|nr:VIT domain-containing protein [Candidatus Nitrospira neomarina]WNM60434.1 VIT domain-containing protein [Candidatus Nitrospira neomarina]